MKAVEDISESLNSLSQVISTSFMFAKSSPMKAKKSLMTCAEYLQSKTFKSTSFVIRFWLVLIDLLKHEHVEILVLTVLSMLQNLIAVLKSKEVQIIITQALKLTASEPITHFMFGLTKCVKSLFYIIKTPEIAKFQKQIWELIKDEEKKSKGKRKRKSTATSTGATTTTSRGTMSTAPGMDPIQEGYHNEEVDGQQPVVPMYDENGNYIDYAENNGNSNNNNNNDVDEESESKQTDGDGVEPENTSSTAGYSGYASYYSPTRAWYGLTSMLSGYTQESDDNDDAAEQDEEAVEEDENAPDENEEEDETEQEEAANGDLQPESGPGNIVGIDNELNYNQQNARVYRSKSVSSSSYSANNAYSNQYRPPSRRTLSYDTRLLPNSSNSIHQHVNHWNAQQTTYRNMSVSTMECKEKSYHQDRMETIQPSSSGSVGINDWVHLIHYIDELEDNGDISINEGDELRKLAMDQKMALLIIYKCYQNKQIRFTRYARNILKEEQEKQSIQQRQPATTSSSHDNNSSEVATTSLDDVRFTQMDAGHEADIVCID